MKKRGFTLIELLAVIVILAIIAIIAVPVMLNVIDKAKKGAAESSVLGYIDAVEKQIVTNKVKNENLIEEGEYTKAQLDEKNVKIKGEITDAVIVVGAKGKVTQGRFYVNGYSFEYNGKKVVLSEDEDYSDGIESILTSCQSQSGTEYTFEYTGDTQLFKVICKGNYKIELWGAQGGSNASAGGLGGYTSGSTQLNKGDKLYIYVGEQPLSYVGGYNGGGDGGYDYSSSNARGGGGATDVRYFGSTSPSTDDLLWNSNIGLNSRIMVAAGGGGSGWCNSTGNMSGSAAGGLNGYGNNYNDTNNRGGSGGTQTSAGASASYSQTSGGFGYGGVGYAYGGGTPQNIHNSGGGGAGYYGGGAGASGRYIGYLGIGGGGSSFISGHNGCDAIDESSTSSNLVHTNQANHYSGKVFTSTKIIDGAGYEWTTSKAASASGMPSHDGSSTITGNSGNGYAKITYLGR